MLVAIRLWATYFHSEPGRRGRGIGGSGIANVYFDTEWETRQLRAALLNRYGVPEDIRAKARSIRFPGAKASFVARQYEDDRLSLFTLAALFRSYADEIGQTGAFKMSDGMAARMGGLSWRNGTPVYEYDFLLRAKEQLGLFPGQDYRTKGDANVIDVRRTVPPTAGASPFLFLNLGARKLMEEITTVLGGD